MADYRPRTLSTCNVYLMPSKRYVMCAVVEHDSKRIAKSEMYRTVCTRIIGLTPTWNNTKSSREMVGDESFFFFFDQVKALILG